jgi:hypothetical protein
MDRKDEIENVEIITSEEDDFYSDDDLYNINSWGADLSFRELITMYDENELLKPEIQRNYVWQKPEASRFIESILMGLPVPSIFLAKKGTRKLIVDGYQRIMTVRDYVKGVFSKDNSVFKLSNSNKINPRWRGKTFEQLSDDDKRKIKSTTIHAIIFEQKEPRGTDTSLYQVFERINTGGRTLTPQEIRNCIYQGRLNKLLIELNKIKEWREFYGTSNPDDRMRDIEFILRFFALNTSEILKSKTTQISLKKHLNLFMGDKKNNSENAIKRFEKDFKDTMHFIKKNIGINAFHNVSIEEDGTYRIIERFHPTIFDSIAIATLIAIRYGKEVFENLNEKRLKLLRDEDYIKYIGTRTTNIEHIRGRINLALKYLYDIS